jgi:SAM-dependent methyltransferase
MLMNGLSDELIKASIKFCLESDPSPRRWHVTRLYMYSKLENLLGASDSPNKRGLAISRSLPLARILGLNLAKIEEVNFPEFDLTALPFGDGQFDFCVSDQVLEHLTDPFAAVAESFRVVKPGGYVVITTCFMNELHLDPVDFWRFTPAALELLCKPNRAEILEIGGWGNREVWAYIDAGFRFEKIPENPQNPIYNLVMKNESAYSITTWVVAKKTTS